MIEWMQLLLKLQEKDLRIGKIEAQLKAVPEEKAHLASDLTAEEAQVAAAKEKVKAAEMSIKALEIEAQGLQTKTREFQSKSAMIKSNEEYRAALSQIETCKQQIRLLEDKELVSMEELEQARRFLDAEKKKLAAAHQRVKETGADLDIRARNCQGELEKMNQERLGMLEGIAGDVLRFYDRMRARRLQDPEHRAFVPIRNGACDGCHMNVTAQVRVNVSKGQMGTCQYCGRILYVED